MNTGISSLYDFLLQQVAAESYFEGANLDEPETIADALVRGTNRLGFQSGPPDLNQGFPGYTRMTSSQADEFLRKFGVVDQWSDNPTILNGVEAPRPALPGDPGYLELNGQQILANTGLSATLIQARDSSGNLTNEYTLAIRSTEFRYWSEGGDYQRDAFGADALSVAFNGFALAQLDALEQYYQWLKVNGKLPTGAKLNVTGYSLGGHLATVFTEIHQAEMNGGQTVTFNGAGRGSWDNSVGTLADMIAYYHAVLNDAAIAPIPLNGTVFTRAIAVALKGQPFDAKSLYADPRYTWAVLATADKFGLGWQPLSDEGRTGTSADAIITQAFGYETLDNVNFTANSGIHGPALRVGIESQPLNEPDNFGNGHSITLIGDSLALQRALYQLDSTYTLDKFVKLLPATTNRIVTNGADANYEVDALENVLDALRAIVLDPGIAATPAKEGGSGFGDITTREQFHTNLDELVGSQAFQDLIGKVVIQPITEAATANLTTQAKARVDFETYVALKTLSPFVVNPAGAGGQSALNGLWQSDTWSEQYTEWKHDKELITAGKDPEAFTDQYFADRALLLQSLLWRNSENIATGTAVDNLSAPVDRALDVQYDETGTAAQMRVWNPGGNGASTLGSRPHQLIAFGDDEGNAFAGTEETKFGDHLYGGGGNDTIRGFDGSDWIEGNLGDDVMGGDPGMDVLLGGSGDDTLNGGEGLDSLVGGPGDDTYFFEGHIGIDVVIDSDRTGAIAIAGANGAEMQLLTGGHKLAEDVWLSEDSQTTYARMGDDLVIRLGAAGGATGLITVRKWQDGDLGITLDDTPASTFNPSKTLVGDFVKRIEDGQYVLGPDGNYLGNGSQPGAADMLTGGSGTNLIQGLGGNDALIGRNAADVLEGGAGVDLLFGGLGADTLKGGAGIDVLYGSHAGTVVYRLNVMENEPVSEPDYFVGFNWGMAFLWREADNFPVWGFATVSTEMLLGDADNLLDGGAGNDIIAMGTGFDVAHGAADADDIYGGYGNDVIFGDEGDDRLRGDVRFADWQIERGSYFALYYGQDALDGGEGNDTLFGGGFEDVLYGGEGDDILYGDDKSLTDTPVAFRGDDSLLGGAGNDMLYGDEGNDILEGGAGNDTLDGGPGRDVYVIRKGEGVDVIIDTLTEANVFRFGPGISKSDITLGLGSLRLDLGGGQQVHLDGFDPGNALGSAAGASFEFADGGVLSSGELLARGFDIDGSDGNDTLVGTSGSDRIRGYGGNDLLTGGAGADQFFVDATAGTVTITDADEEDMVVLGEGMTTAQLAGRGGLEGDALVIRLSGGTVLRVVGDAAYELSTGERLSREAMLDLLSTPTPPAGGTTITDLYDEQGHLIGSSVRVVTAYGTTITIHAGAGGTGARLSDTWTTVRGGHGADTFHADGSSSGIAYAVDGGYTTYTDSGVGDRLQENFDASGVKASAQWRHADGSWGYDVFDPDGSSTGEAHHPDGGYEVYTDDGHGHVRTTHYNADGTPQSVIDEGGRYPNTSETPYANGNLRVTTDYAPGESRSTLFDANGAKLGDSWTTMDGSHGQTTYAGEASHSIVYAANGWYKTIDREGSQSITRDYTAEGVLRGSVVSQVDGLNRITTYLDGLGGKLHEAWVHPDGSTGIDMISARDYNGLSNLMARVQPGTYRSWSMDGQPQLPAAQGYLSIRHAGYMDSQTWIGSASQPRFDLELYYATPEYAAEDSPSNFYGYGQFRVTGAYHLYDFGSRLAFHGVQTLEGRKLLVVVDNGKAGELIDLGLAGDATRLQIYTATGYDIFRDDGQGNLSISVHAMDGHRQAQMWLHNDGSNGADFFDADGTSTGVSANPEGLYLRYERDAHGQVTDMDFSAGVIGIYEPPAPPVPPDPIIHVRPPVPRIGSPEGGTQRSVTGQYEVHTYTNEDLTRDIVNSPEGNPCDQYQFVSDGNGHVVARAKIFTDPGYDLAVAQGDGFTGWTYDDAGRAIARYVDDGHGTVQTWRLDVQGRVSGREVAVGVGAATLITRYDSADRPIGLVERTQVATGHTRTDSFDAAGRLTGWSEEYADGRGNSVVCHYDAQGQLTSQTAKVVVGSDGLRTEIRSWDGAGAATGLIVTATSAQGVIQTDNYDAAGHLTGTVVATTLGNGDTDTVNYDAAGAITSFVRLRINADLSSTISTFDADGRKLRDDNLSQGGTHASTEYSLDGASLTTTRAADGSFSTVARDVDGGWIETLFSADGEKLGDRWERGDGSQGAHSFHPDGSASGGATYADGSTDSSLTTASGRTTTTHRDAQGAVTGTTVTTHGDAETRIAHYDARGIKLQETWRDAEGDNGLKTWNADGSSRETLSFADGSTGDASDDGAGNTLFDRYYTSGEVYEEWAQADGSHGFTDYHLDGTESGKRFAPDGSYLQFQGNRDATTFWRYDAAGSLIDTFVNHPPVAQPLADLSTYTGRAFNYTIPPSVFSDVDAGDSLSYSATGFGTPLPAWLHFNPATRSFSGTPSSADVGPLLLQVTATDSRGASAYQYFTLNIQLGGPVLTGTSAADSLTGGAGADRLDGLAGLDTMRGGDGDDLYIVDDIKDKIIELPNQGYDSVESSASFRLPDHVESLTLTGTGGTTATGNAGNNLLTGNGGTNRMEGGLGADTMAGGAGNDTYIVDDAGDVVLELANEGADSVQASVAYTLSAQVESLTLTGSAVLSGTGNELDNTLTANAAGSVLHGLAGNDSLRGAAGADTMYGGLDDDIYYIDTANDVVVELDGQGHDMVRAPVSSTLPDWVEEMVLTTSAAINGTGNGLANAMDGNAGANWLRGMGGNDTLQGYAGNDTMEGGAGNDRLVGNAGADTYLFARGDGQDSIADYDTTPGVQDVLKFGNDIAAEQLWFRQRGGVLEISVVGTPDKVSIDNWWGPNNCVEVIELASGQFVLKDQVVNLVKAMAPYTPPPLGQTTLPPTMVELVGVIHANWH